MRKAKKKKDEDVLKKNYIVQHLCNVLVYEKKKSKSSYEEIKKKKIKANDERR